MAREREDGSDEVVAAGERPPYKTKKGRKRAAESSLGVDEATAIAEAFQSKRTNANTKRTYASKVGVIRVWLAARFPALVLDGENFALPLPSDAVIAFFGHLTEPADSCEKSRVHADDMECAPLSVSCVTGYRSALVDLYRTHALELGPALDAELKRTLDGYEKTINKLKQLGLMDTNEGKRCLKSSGYDLLSDKLMKQRPVGKGLSWGTTVFSWSFFVLMWNLMSRSDSIEKIMLEHIEWADDALVIEEQGHKGDQTGADKFGKHVYANPYEPHKCPILALAVQLFSFPDRLNGRHRLFVGSDNKGRFGRALRRVINGLSEDEFQILGCDGKDIGTHSLRKGSSTYALAQVSGPTPVSVYLRMGQSLGKLKDRYIHFGEGADQLCGRMIAGLPFDSERFGVLPPHFHPSVANKLTQQFWTETVSGFEKYPLGARTACPYLLASLIFHEEFLRTSLDPKHPIFTARVFSNNPLLQELRGSTVIAIGVSPVCSIKATGIPPHLAIAAKVKCVSDDVLHLKTVLDSLPAVISTTVVHQLRESFAIDGVLPLTLRDVESRLSSLRDDLLAAFETRSPVPAVAQTADVDTANAGTCVAWRSWDWKDGKLWHTVPPGWEFPTLANVKSMWDLWHFGDKNTGIRPYKHISRTHDIAVKQQRMRYQRVASVMKALDKLVPDGVGDVSQLSPHDADLLFKQTFIKLLDQIYPVKKNKRHEETTCGTIYNRLCSSRKENHVQE